MAHSVALNPFCQGLLIGGKADSNAAARQSLLLTDLDKLARRVDIARSSIGIAVRAGAPKPDVSSAEA